MDGLTLRKRNLNEKGMYSARNTGPHAVFWSSFGCSKGGMGLGSIHSPVPLTLLLGLIQGDRREVELNSTG